MATSRSKRFCKHGHDLDVVGVYLAKNGSRCRECKRAESRRQTAKRRQRLEAERAAAGIVVQRGGRRVVSERTVDPEEYLRLDELRERTTCRRTRDAIKARMRRMMEEVQS
jgi:hypothetical protein